MIHKNSLSDTNLDSLRGAAGFLLSSATKTAIHLDQYMLMCSSLELLFQFPLTQSCPTQDPSTLNAILWSSSRRLAAFISTSNPKGQCCMPHGLCLTQRVTTFANPFLSNVECSIDWWGEKTKVGTKVFKALSQPFSSLPPSGRCHQNVTQI